MLADPHEEMGGRTRGGGNGQDNGPKNGSGYSGNSRIGSSPRGMASSSRSLDLLRDRDDRSRKGGGNGPPRPLNGTNGLNVSVETVTEAPDERVMPETTNTSGAGGLHWRSHATPAPPTVVDTQKDTLPNRHRNGFSSTRPRRSCLASFCHSSVKVMNALAVMIGVATMVKFSVMHVLQDLDNMPGPELMSPGLPFDMSNVKEVRDDVREDPKEMFLINRQLQLDELRKAHEARKKEEEDEEAAAEQRRIEMQEQWDENERKYQEEEPFLNPPRDNDGVLMNLPPPPAEEDTPSDIVPPLEATPSKPSAVTRARAVSQVLQLLDTYKEEHSEETLRKELELCLERRLRHREQQIRAEMPQWEQQQPETEQRISEPPLEINTDGIANNMVHDTDLCPEIARRRYAIGMYSCPYQAGNRMLHFLNNFAWAIATNRTLLWKYYDKETCETYGGGFPKEICEFANREVDCASVLHRDAWIPEFDVFVRALGLVDVATDVPYWTTRVHPRMLRDGTYADMRSEQEKRLNPWRPGMSENEAGFDEKGQATFIAHFGQMMGNEFEIFEHGRHRRLLLHSKDSQERAYRLVEAGSRFMYGALFHVAFRYNKKVLPRFRLPISDASHWTIALHSRHIDNNDFGSEIERETHCLEKLIPTKEQLESGEVAACTVFMMADRQATLNGLKDWLKERGCNPYVAKHSKGESFAEEHGRFAGLGFYQDVVVAAHARHAVVRGRRSSSMLVDALTTYAKLIEEGDKTESTAEALRLYEKDKAGYKALVKRSARNAKKPRRKKGRAGADADESTSPEKPPPILPVYPMRRCYMDEGTSDVQLV